MTHDDAIATLVALAAGGAEPTPATRADAEAHVAVCSDCWEALAALVARTTGAPPADAARMQALFGCGPVREDLHLLVGLPTTRIATEYPVLARHLSWCVACRDRLVALEAFEALAAAPRPAAVWTHAAGVGETVRTAAGRLVARARQAVAGFATVPPGFTLGPAVALAATRGPAAEVRAPLHASARVPLPEGDLTAELALEPEGGGRVRLLVRVSGADTGPLVLELREARDEAPALLVRHTPGPGEPLVAAGLSVGSYFVDIRRERSTERFRLHLDVEPCA